MKGAQESVCGLEWVVYLLALMSPDAQLGGDGQSGRLEVG